MIRRIRPVWPCPRNIRAFTTTRLGGVSQGPWNSLNLGDASGDQVAAVRENRARFELALPGPAGWLRQVHGRQVVRRESCLDNTPEADAVVGSTPGLPCTVLTADCLPVLLCTRTGDQVAAVHAGWRGLVAGVLQASLQAMDAEPALIMAWLGPGISQAAYQVDGEMRQQVLESCPESAPLFVQDGQRWRADLFGLARQVLQASGVDQIYGGQHCTHGDPQRFFSYRRDGATGRMATTIWIQHAPVAATQDTDEAPA